MQDNIYQKLRESTETDKTPPLTQGQLADIFSKEGYALSQSVISKLETSKKNPPTTSFDVIKAYSNHFKVTADYLLGLRDTKPIDENIAMINKVTGLDENAINTLKKISNEDIDILNFIMKDFFTFYCFLSNIKNFISGDFDTPIYFERDKNGKGYSKPQIGVDIKKESPISTEKEKNENYLYIQNSKSADNGFIAIPVSMTKTFFMDCIREQMEDWKKEYKKECD